MWVDGSAKLHTDVTETPNTRKVVNAPNMFATNEWTLVTWTRDGISTTIYKNGVEVRNRCSPSKWGIVR